MHTSGQVLKSNKDQAPDTCQCFSMAGYGALIGISNSHTDSAITPAEVAAALIKAKRHKAAGKYGIFPDFSRDGKDILFQPLC